MCKVVYCERSTFPDDIAPGTLAVCLHWKNKQSYVTIAWASGVNVYHGDHWIDETEVDSFVETLKRGYSIAYTWMPPESIGYSAFDFVLLCLADGHSVKLTPWQAGPCKKNKSSGEPVAA